MKNLMDAIKGITSKAKTSLQTTRLNIRQQISSFLVILLKQINAKKYPVYVGTIKKVKLNQIKKNLVVLTEKGLGKLKNSHYRGSLYHDKTRKVSVLLNDMTVSEEFPKDHVFTLEVVDSELFIGRPLHPYFYKYVAHAIDEEVKYHISKEDNVLLSKDEVNRLQIIAVINSTKGGTKVINRLRKHKLLNLLNL